MTRDEDFHTRWARIQACLEALREDDGGREGSTELGAVDQIRMSPDRA